ncbi:hypothetical protein ONZ45_g16201 [Pleurotus djamor]|nr:hypothetical protein ONZ45_g16201 [Pleurotus djamor]
MDPLALTTSIIELGLSIKESIDKCLRNSDLYRVHKRCQIYEPKKNDAKYKRLASIVKLWMESDEIEADLVRVKERIQTSMNCLSLLSNGRVEVRVAKMESILVNMYEGRRHIQQFDSAFTQGLLSGDPGLGAFDRSPSELSRIDIQYIYVKTEDLIRTISRATLDIGKKLVDIGHAYSGTPTKPTMHHIIFRTAELQALATSGNILIRDLRQHTIPLVRMLNQLGAMDIVQNMLDTIEHRLRQTLRLGTYRLRLPRHVKEEEEDALDFLELILRRQHCYTSRHVCNQSAACSLCDGDIKRASEHIQFSRSRLERRASPSNDSRMRFLWSLRPSIRFHAIRGEVEQCFSYCAEALEVIQPCLVSTTREKNIIRAGALQLQVDVLVPLSFAQARNGDYTSAYYTGTECFSSLIALSNIDKSLLPDNFDYLPYVSEYMQRKMPTWTSVVRNPENRRTSYIEDYIDEDDPCHGSPRQIEWGIAL